MRALIAIFFLAWLLVLIGAIVVFELIVPQSFCGCVYDGVVKAALAAILGVVWILILAAMRNELVKRTLKSVA